MPLVNGKYRANNKDPRVPANEVPAEVRAKNFEPVDTGYTTEDAIEEANRCLDCKKPHCVAGCPVGIDIPTFIRQIRDEDFAGGLATIRDSNMLPSVCGRVCPQENQCEGNCILNKTGNDPIAIGQLERFLGDMTESVGATPQCKPANGKKVAVVGSGPSGIACAGALAREGFDVTVFEAFQTGGGVLTYGIPEFRLPKAIVKREIDGANEYLTRVNLMKAMDFPEFDTPIKHGKNVVVFGGGNVAMDAARTALRLGAESVTLAYRRTEKEMPARVAELHHAKEEGVRVLELVSPLEFEAGEDGFVAKVKLERMELGEPDDSGRRRPVRVEGSEFELPCDVAITAIGTNANPFASKAAPVKLNKWGYIEADEDGRTSDPRVWAGGDIVTGAATVILAMGAGKQAAASMTQALLGEDAE